MGRLTTCSKNTGAKVSYRESTQESDYVTNLDKLVDDGNSLIWGVGFAMADAVAESNPNMEKEVYKKTMEVQDKITAGEIVPPYNKETLNSFNQ